MWVVDRIAAMSTANWLRRLARKNNVVVLDDPDAVSATLQIAARLLANGWTQGYRFERVGDGMRYDILGALDAAVGKSAAKDDARAWWGAHRLISRAIPSGFGGDVSAYNDDPARTQGQVVELIRGVARSHGTVLQAQKKVTPA